MTSHAERAHARLSPSAAHRWMACPGSARLSAGIETTSSVFADEGTAAHELAAHCLMVDRDAHHWRDWFIDIDGRDYAQKFLQAPGGPRSFKVTGEMVDAVQMYVDVVKDIFRDADDSEIEQRVDLSPIIEGVYGTGDAIAYMAGTRRVVVCDFKYGRGVAVDVQENEQLLMYALGITQRYHNRGVDGADLIIVQPRAPHRDGPIRRWSTDLLGLYEHAIAARKAAALAAQPDAPLVAGSHCKFCPATAVCPAAWAAVLDIIGDPMADPTTYDPAELAAKLKRAPQVADWLRALEQFGHREAMAGRVPAGFKLVGKRAIRKWKDDSAAVSVLRVLGVDDDALYETKLRSPAQVEKDIPPKDRSVMAGLVQSVSSGTALVPLEDPRPSVNPADASGFEAQDIGE